ncbi:alpha/beta hydrolase [Candidatus Lokiarchaeum ossiferum]|uniref:alpha/beta hydrolase n=1 Tax=Candidatus Lokiarchaeum ossiferum TaxID=2951803 RepID=UPI00352ED2E3
MKTRKEIVIFGLVFVIFLSFFGIFSIFPANIRRTYNQTTVTSDGVSIVYDVFEPKSDTPSLRTGVILGHGVMVNKNFMRTIALDLASQGFVAIALDFRGHGRSGGTLEEGDITTDILAIKEVMTQRGDINMTNLGYIGYSMGGGAGFRLLDTDPDFKAMVSLAAGGRTQYNTPNLLILHGKWDEAFSLTGVLEYMSDKTGLSEEEIETDRLYGSFQNGTALKLCIANTDHLLAPYDYNNVRETRFWFLQALNGETSPNSTFTNYFLLLSSVILATLSGIYLFLLGTDLVLSKIYPSSQPKELTEANLDLDQSELKVVMRKYWIFVLPLSIPCMVLALPLLPVPIFNMVLFSALLLGPSTAILLFQFYILKKNRMKLKEYYSQFWTKSTIKNCFTGLLFGMLFYIILNLTIGYIFGIVPSTTKWGWAILFFVVMLFIQFNFAQFFQPLVLQGNGFNTIKQRFRGQLSVFILFFSPIVMLVLISLLIFQSWFNIQFLLPLLPLIIIINLISGRFYQRSHDVIIAVFTNSLYLTLLLITLANY